MGPSLVAFWSAGEGNLDRFRRRLARARASPLSETMGPITLDDGSVLQAPSDDEMLPVEQHIPLSLSAPSDLVNSEFRPIRGNGGDGYVPNLHTPKRSGVDLDAPFPQRARMASQQAKD